MFSNLRNKLKELFIVIILTIITISLFSDFFTLKLDHDLEIYFLNIGQGDSMLIKTPNGRFGLIDSGTGEEILYELNAVLPYFSKSLEFIVFSHADTDHIGGFYEVLKRFNVKKVFANKTDKNTLTFNNSVNEIKTNEIINYELKVMNDFEIDGVNFDVIWPNDGMVYTDFENINNSSIGLHIRYEQFDLVTMGDLESEFELKAIHNMVIKDRVEFLKVGHHGSRTSSSDAVLEALRPINGVISCGIDNSYGHPHKETLDNLAKYSVNVLRTDQMGRIKVETDGFTYKID